MGLQLTDRGYGKELVYSIQATAYIDRETVEGLTNEQLARLEHHVTEVSRRVFAASVAGMVKGVQKYPSEPLRKDQAAYWRDVQAVGDVQGYWLPHIFSARRWTAPIKPAYSPMPWGWKCRMHFGKIRVTPSLYAEWLGGNRQRQLTLTAQMGYACDTLERRRPGHGRFTSTLVLTRSKVSMASDRPMGKPTIPAPELEQGGGAAAAVEIQEGTDSAALGRTVLRAGASA